MKLPFKDRKFIFLISAVLLVVALEILSLTGIEIPMPFAPFVFAVCILAIGYKVLWNGLKALVTLKFSSINLLMMIAAIGAFYLGEYPEAAVVIVLYVLGERLEDIGIENSKSTLDNLISKSPRSAKIKGIENVVAIDKIKIGSIVQIKAGDYIPMDGEIVEGNTSIDESPITGEPIPIDKHKGDLVFAGTINKQGYIEIKTTKISADTTFSKIIQLTFQAQANKSDTQKFIQKFSKKYTPAIMLLSALVFLIPVLILHEPFEKWLNQAISLLVIACPCALVISTPVAFYAAIGNASSKGALIKGGKYLESLAQIKAIALDKTRTITDGKPVVSDIFPLEVKDKEELLACAAGAEMFSEHPLAQAIVDVSLAEGFTPHAVQNFKSESGKGLIADCLVCADEKIFIGKLDFIREHQPITKEAELIVENLSKQGKTSVVISYGNGVAGIIGLTDAIKEDSKAAIQAFIELGITPIMLTGDNTKAANFVGAEVKITEVYGNLLPEDKAQKIADMLKKYVTVAMVGDGINDAPALALSSVGIAMGAVGSDTAIETANIALMNDKLSLIPFLIRLGIKTLNRIKINTIAAISIKVIFIFLAFLGYSNLALAITADVGVTLVVILYSLQLMNFEG